MNEEQKAMKEIERKIKKENSFNFIKAFKDNMNKIMILAISIVYLLYGLLLLKEKEASLLEILGSIAISLFIGTLITLCMLRDGISSGRKDFEFVEAKKNYDNQVDKIAPNLEKLSPFCNIKNTQDLQTAKKDYIEAVGLNYRAWNKGYYKNYDMDKLNDEQKHALATVDNLKIVRLTSTELLSDSPRLTEKQYQKYGKFGKTSSQYVKYKTTGKVVWTLIFSIVFGYFSVELMVNENTISTLIWNAFQLIMWIANGAIQFFDSKNFMITEYKETHLIAKIRYLKEFEAVLVNNPEILKKYSDDDEIEQFLKEKENEKNDIKEGQDLNKLQGNTSQPNFDYNTYTDKF